MQLPRDGRLCADAPPLTLNSFFLSKHILLSFYLFSIFIQILPKNMLYIHCNAQHRQLISCAPPRAPRAPSAPLPTALPLPQPSIQSVYSHSYTIAALHPSAPPIPRRASSRGRTQAGMSPPKPRPIPPTTEMNFKVHTT